MKFPKSRFFLHNFPSLSFPKGSEKNPVISVMIESIEETNDNNSQISDFTDSKIANDVDRGFRGGGDGFGSRSTGSSEKKRTKKWYVGKFLGREPPSHLLEPDSDDMIEEIETIRHSMKMGGDQLEKDTTDTDVGDESKNEKMFIRMVRNIRKKFTARRLIGKIYIYRVAGFVSTAMRCHIDEAYYRQQSQSFSGIDDLQDLDYTYKKAITTTDAVLDSLERRAKSWNGVDVDDDIMLTRGARFGIRGPYLGIIGYIVQLELSATVHSLNESRKRFEELKRANAASNSSSIISPFSRMSFNFFPSSTTNSANSRPSSENNSQKNKKHTLTSPIAPLQPQLTEANDSNDDDDASERSSLVMI